MPASPYDYKLPNYLTDEDLKKIRRQKIWLGKFGVHEDTKEKLLEQRAREAGLGAIENIRSREDTGRMALDKMNELSRNVQSKSDDKEALSRFADSPGMQAHLETLQNLQPDFNQLVEEEVTSKGLGQLPAVKDFLTRREYQMAGEAASADTQKTKNQMLELGMNLVNKPEYRELGMTIVAIAKSGDIDKYKDILKNIGAAGQSEVTTEGAKDVELLKQFGGEKLQEKKQEDIMEQLGFKRETQMMVEKARVDRAANVDMNKPNFKTANLELKLGNTVKTDKRVKDFGIIDSQFSKMQTVWSDYVHNRDDMSPDKLKQSRIGIDQALIMIFNKMLDPISVVRESEFARTPQAEGVMERIKAVIPKLQEGGVGISDRDREELVRTAQMLTDAGRDGYNKIINNYREAFSGYSHLGVNPDRIIKSFEIELSEPAEVKRSLFGDDEEEEDYTDEDESRYQELLRKQREGTLR